MAHLTIPGHLWFRISAIGGRMTAMPVPGPVPLPVLMACALTFVLYIGTYIRLPLVPLFASGLGASTVEVGMINAGFMIAAALLAVPLGLVSDRLGRRRLILAGMIASALTSLLLVAARTPAQVGAVYLISGVGLACFSPAMMSYVGDVAPPSFLGRAYGWYTSALYLGMALGPGLGGAIGAAGFRAAFLVSAAVVGAAIVVGIPRLPAPPPVMRAGSPDLRADLAEILANRAVVACWTVTFFTTYAWGATFSFFPLYARDCGISVAHTGLIFTSQAASNALCRIPIGHLADRTGHRNRYIVLGSLGFALCIGGVGLFSSPAPLYALFLLAGASMAAAFTAVGALISESVDTRVRGLAMGGYNTCIYSGFAASAATLGAVIHRSGYLSGFAAAGGLGAAAALVFPLIIASAPKNQ